MAVPASFRNLRLPVVAAPMFLTSGPDLIVACCEAGVLGTFPALNQRTSAGLDEWLSAIETRLAEVRARGGEPAPYGVNLIVHKTNPRLQADLEILARHRVPLVITSLGAARDVVEAVHAYGGLVFHDVTTTKHARKAAEAGVDGLIAVAAGAGGHAGTWSPFALLREIRRFFDKTVLLAGCISTGEDIAAAQMMGADLAYMGTRFIATREALVPETYKQMLTEAGAADIVYTASISSLPASFLRQSIAAAGLDPDNLAPPGAVDLSHITQPHDGEREAGAPVSHKKPWRDIWSAGQGVGAIDDLPPARELIERLTGEYRQAAAAFTRSGAPFL